MRPDLGDSGWATMAEKLALGSHAFEDNLERQRGAGYTVEALGCQANALYGQLKETVFPIHLNLS